MAQDPSRAAQPQPPSQPGQHEPEPAAACGLLVVQRSGTSGGGGPEGMDAAAPAPPASHPAPAQPSAQRPAAQQQGQDLGSAAPQQATQPAAVDVSRQTLRPGEPVWAKLKGAAPFPALVITREEALREGLAPRHCERAGVGGGGEGL
jgi:hypothetical protein